jgi:hypothetical protein
MRWATPFALALLGGCGGSQVTMVGNVQSLPVQVSAELESYLATAIAETEEVLGHPVEFCFNAEMMPRDEYFYRDLFEEQIGWVPRDLRRLEERDPRTFAHVARDLKNICFDYDGAARHARAKFVHEEGTASYLLSSSRIPKRILGMALREEYLAHRLATYGHLQPEDVDDDEQAIYFEVLSTQVFRRSLAGQDADDMTRDSGAVDRAVRLERMVGGALKKEARAWLVEQVEYFGYQYQHSPDEVERAPAAFEKAEAAYLTWLSEVFGELGGKAQWKVFEWVLKTSHARIDKGLDDRFARRGFSVFDRGLEVIDRWRDAGHPVADEERTANPEQALYEQLVRPIRRDDAGERDVSHDSAIHSLVVYALRRPAYRERLLRALLQRKDDKLTETVIWQLITAEKRSSDIDVELLIQFWRAMKSHPRTAAVATRVIAEDDRFGSDDKRKLYDEALTIWNDDPARRGEVLYILALQNDFQPGVYASSSEPGDKGYYRLFKWKHFHKTFGRKIKRQELRAFIAMGSRAIEELHHVVPAIDGPLAGTLTPRLGAFFADPEVTGRHAIGPQKPLLELVTAIEDHGDAGDIRSLNSDFRRRASQAGGERAMLENLAAMTDR